ncbi:MAG: BREX-1 system adenine-specific DNA-methyltransferase PglX, partial [Desulfobacterales bacterium]|nr:BREX-1 system adenine-specific DNA-methyltransferase PglX [Desulfobacterales bacterium]
MAFDQTTRKLLENFVAAARRNLSTEFTRQLQRDYGMDPETGEISDLARLTHLDDSRRQTARLLRETLEHYVAANPTGGTQEALKRIVREQAFTVLNRLCALRMAEARDFLIESIGNGYQSKGFQLYMHLAGTALGETGEAYRCYLFSLFDEFSVDLPVLFDRYSPMGRLFPKPEALVSGNPSKPGIIDLINGPEIAPLWSEDETIGWIYQYFNSKEERKAMRDASAAPRNSRELAVRNQFFTPRYVVEFLTDNTLGRIWYEMRKGETDLKEECRYLVRRPNEIFLAPGENAPSEDEDDAEFSQEKLLKRAVYIEHRPKKDPRDLKVLDPACGSGHFLLYAFDLLARIYEEAWDDPESAKSEASGSTLREDYQTANDFRRNVPELILRWNLHGIDIDHRAVQIAALALWLRAQKSWQNQGIKAGERPRIIKSNIVTAEPMPGEEDMRREFTNSLKPRVIGQLVDVVFESMKLAGEAGSLLKIEEEIKDSIAEARKQWLKVPKPEQQLLFSGMSKPRPKQMALQFDLSGVTDEQFWEQAEERILGALADYAQQVENGQSVRRRLFAEDAARGFAFVDLCRKRYDVVLMNPPFGDPSDRSKKWIAGAYPITKNDILGPFLERAIMVLHKGGGVGAITSRTAFQLSSMEGFRKELILKETTIRAFLDLGGDVLDSAMVKTAAYALSKAREDVHSAFINLTDSSDKGVTLTLEIAGGLSGRNVFWIKQSEFIHTPGTPLAYWADNVVRQCFGKLPSLSSLNAKVKQGLGTTDDFRFVRAAWEISPALIGVQNHWVFYAKGGESNDFHSDVHLLVNWADGGREVYEFNGIPYGGAGAPIRNPTFYFKPGLTHTSYTNKGFSPRVLPGGCIFTTAGMGIFVPDPLPILSILNSRVIQLFLLTITDERKWEVGYVGNIPIKEPDSEERRKLSDLALRGWREAVLSTLWDETQRLFAGLAEAGRISSLRAEAERLKTASENFGDNLRRIRRQIDERVLKLYGLSTRHMEFVDMRLGIATEEDPAVADMTDILLSLLLGTIFGRWDIRFELDNSLLPKLPDPFDPLPVCPPSMLVGPDGLPAVSGRIVSEEWMRARPDANTLPPEGTVRSPTITDGEYPLRVSWGGILVDDPGFEGGQPHREDIVHRVRDVLDLLWKDKAHEIEQEACGILGVPDLRDYFRKPSG